MREKKEIIILALGTSRLQCPYDAEVWSCNMGYQQIATDHGRIDKIFMVHSQVYSKGGNPYFNWEHFKHLSNEGCELLNIHKVKGVPFKKYPLDRIIHKLNFSYFSDTIGYMIAYALYKYTKRDKTGKLILKQPLKLRLYGVDMWESSEYTEEKGGIEAWLGYALGLGVEIVISNGSSLFLTVKHMPYGMESPELKYYDPFGLMDGKQLTPKQQETKIKAMQAKMKNPKISWIKYRGEFCEGLHRDKTATLDRLPAKSLY